MNSLKPLDDFPLVRSRDVEEVREAIARVYSRPMLTPTGGVEGFNTVFNNCRLQSIQLAYGTYGTDVRLEFPANGYFSQLLPLGGTGEIVRGRSSVPLTEGAGAVISPGAPHTAKYSADYEHLVLRIDARMLIGKLRALTGAVIAGPLRMDPQQDFRHPAAQMLQDYLPMLVAALEKVGPPFPDWWTGQVEQLLATMFLCGHRHNYSHLLEQAVPDASLQQVRQAEEYMAANARRAITVEELAAVTGASAFSLAGAFKRHRGYSPLQFLAQVRSRQGGATR